MDAIGIAASALTTHRKWMDAISDNLANINTATRTSEAAFQERFIEVVEKPGTTGVEARSVQFGDAEGRLTYAPDHPLADENGYIRLPDIDMGAQMGHLILAQRGYQANAAIVDRAKSSYEAAIQIGRS